MRKARAKKFEITPDPRFGETLVTSFVNNLMLTVRKALL